MTTTQETPMSATGWTRTGVTPAMGMTTYEAVVQSHGCHPDWPIGAHVSWLAENGYEVATVEGERPEDVVGRWVAALAAGTTPTAVGTTAEPRPMLTAEQVDAISAEVEEFAEDWACGDDPPDWHDDYVDRAERQLNIDLGSQMDGPGIKRFLAISRRVRREAQG